MLYFIVPFVLLVSTALVVRGQCPDVCRCPSSQLANCSAVALNEIPRGRFAPFMQQLDISGNFIGTLDQTSLQGVGVSSLERLNASNNRIYYIHEEAFVRHSKLQTLDFSRNELEFIEPNTFKQNRLLKTLLLANNEMLKLPEGGSFLNTQSLKVLDLSACNLSNIPPNTFRELPNLQALHISHNKFKALPHLQWVQGLNILDVGHNYLTDLNPDVFSASPKLSRLNLSYNKLSSLNTTVASQLPKESKREDFEGNPWVCDCTFCAVHSWCSSHGVDLEIVCSSPQKCNGESWNVCYEAGCDGGCTGVDKMGETVTNVYTAVPSLGFENSGNKKASDSEETTLNFGINGTYYTRQPTEGLENRGQEKEPDSSGIQMRGQENTIYLFVLIALILTVVIVFPAVVVIQCHLSKTRRLQDTGRNDRDTEAAERLQNPEP